MGRALASRCLVSLVLAVAAPAHATESSNDQALELQTKAVGDSLMKERRFSEALEAYDRAFALYADPRLHYDRAAAYRALERFPEALDELDAFRGSAPPEDQRKIPDLSTEVEALRDKVSSILVTSPVHGALVTLRGKVLGTTPLPHPFRVNAGPAALEIRAEDYETLSEDVTLEGHHALVIERPLVKKPGATTLLIRSSVRGAHVKLDGRDLGVVPAEASVVPGAHRVGVTHPDYEPTELSTVVALGQSRTVDVDLEGKQRIYEKWWFWTGIGVVAAGTVAAVIIHNTSRSQDSGDIAPGKLSAPLRLDSGFRF